MASSDTIKTFNNWTDFKNEIETREIVSTLQYEELDNNESNARYFLWATDAFVIYQYLLYHTESSDKTDFDNNYKATANQKLQFPVIVTNTINASVVNPTGTPIETTGGFVTRKNPIRYFVESSEAINTCNPSTWTVFYTKTFDTSVYFEEVLINIENDHYIKIELSEDGTNYITILEVSIDFLDDIIPNGPGNGNSNNSRASNFLALNYYDNLTTSLEGHIGKSLKISQKRRDSKTKNLEIQGYIIVYRTL